MINNVLYVIILSAALDLVGPTIPKGVVLLADVVPSFLTKLIAPYFIQAVPYSFRIWIFVVLSSCGMLLVALIPNSRDGGTISIRMVGVILASLSSGGGELSFLGLTHFYGPWSLAAWGSGTGGAGLIGAGAYAIATTSLGLSAKNTLLASAFLPLIMLISFFLILPRGHLQAKSARNKQYLAIAPEDYVDEQNDNGQMDDDSLLGGSLSTVPSATSHSSRTNSVSMFQTNLKRARRLFFP